MSGFGYRQDWKSVTALRAIPRYDYQDYDIPHLLTGFCVGAYIEGEGGIEASKELESIAGGVSWNTICVYVKHLIVQHLQVLRL